MFHLLLGPGLVQCLVGASPRQSGEVSYLVSGAADAQNISLQNVFGNVPVG